MTLYQRAATLITLFSGPGGLKVEIPYKYLLRKNTDEHAHPHLHLNIERLVDGEPLRDASQGKVYRLNREFAQRYKHSLLDINKTPTSIGHLLDPSTFYFSKKLNETMHDPDSLLEISVFDFMPDIVTSAYPHRRMADINTWRQFHRLASYVTDSFDTGERNILIIAGLTIDHTIKRNTFIPQFGFWMQQGRALQARYFSAPELNKLLIDQEVFVPTKTFLEYAEVG